MATKTEKENVFEFVKSLSNCFLLVRSADVRDVYSGTLDVTRVTTLRPPSPPQLGSSKHVTGVRRTSVTTFHQP